jgi:hypothetical protein
VRYHRWPDTQVPEGGVPEHWPDQPLSLDPDKVTAEILLCQMSLPRSINVKK